MSEVIWLALRFDPSADRLYLLAGTARQYDLYVATPMLAPVLCLVLWTLVMQGWMYATRVPAIRAARMRLDRKRPRGEQMAELPASVRWKADNYNHLHEQPVLFYAVALILAMIGDTTTASLILAWVYVSLRVVHSLHQALINHIPVRFLLFVTSSLVLLALSLRAVFLLW